MFILSEPEIEVDLEVTLTPGGLLSLGPPRFLDKVQTLVK